MSQSSFAEKVTPAYVRLIESEKAFFNDVYTMTRDEIRDGLEMLRTLEHNVWVAWAEATPAVNPRLAADVERESPKKLDVSDRLFLTENMRVGKISLH